MKLDLKSMYNYLISHTFPGFLLLIECLLALQWFFKVDVFAALEKILSKDSGSIVVLSIIAYAFSTLLGIIVDGIHHLIDDMTDDMTEGTEKFSAIYNEAEHET
ncbi:MAG: hypothetical protein HQK97_00170 [Nitrospirae bacterium]|nr:hypothetical protein [Nitrospirota bacterium]